MSHPHETDEAAIQMDLESLWIGDSAPPDLVTRCLQALEAERAVLLKPATWPAWLGAAAALLCYFLLVRLLPGPLEQSEPLWAEGLRLEEYYASPAEEISFRLHDLDLALNELFVKFEPETDLAGRIRKDLGRIRQELETF
jgi:hypothetical protein